MTDCSRLGEVLRCSAKQTSGLSDRNQRERCSRMDRAVSASLDGPHTSGAGADQHCQVLQQQQPLPAANTAGQHKMPQLALMPALPGLTVPAGLSALFTDTN